MRALVAARIQKRLRALRRHNFDLCVVPVRVQHKDKKALTYAFFNQGSSHSFCDQTLINALKISKPFVAVELHSCSCEERFFLLLKASIETVIPSNLKPSKELITNWSF